MKELEKINRLSIASTLFILVVLIGLLTYKRPKHIFAINTHGTLEKLSNDDYFITTDQINNPNNVLIDLRSHYEFEKGHLENAINIYSPELLSEAHAAIFKEIKESGKTVVLYGNNPQEVNAPFLFLYQMGYDNIKILKAENTYFQNKLVTLNSEVEKTPTDIKAFINESVKNAGSNAVNKVSQPVKKTITVRKKKKKAAEGGC